MKQLSMRDTFFDSLYEIARKDRNVIIVSADMGAPSLDRFRMDLGSQYINVGIAEQSMITVATGLALSGKKVFTYAIMPFVTLRCYEMIKVDLSLMNIPVSVVGVGAGFSYNDSGPTHHATEDIAVMRILPNMTVFSPADSVMAAELAEMAGQTLGPNYVRLDREILPNIYSPGTSFADGLANLKAGQDVCLIATGNMVHHALEVAEKLKEHSVDAGVTDLYRIRPINQELLLSALAPANRVVTLEEHLLSGGMGSAVAELLVDNGKMIPLKRIGIPDKYYYAYGSRNDIQSLCGLDVNSITKTILEYLEKNG